MLACRLQIGMLNLLVYYDHKFIRNHLSYNIISMLLIKNANNIEYPVFNDDINFIPNE